MNSSLNEQKFNNFLNTLEYEKQKTKLSSLPKFVTIGAHWKCNANCKFCLGGGKYPNFSIENYKKFFEPALGNVLKTARRVGFHGYGETLLYPRITEFFNYINKTLPNAVKLFTTNGIALTENISQCLTNGKYSIMVSLHASNSTLHKKLTGTDKFAEIVKNIKRLVRLKKQKKAYLKINLVFVLQRDNLNDLLNFLKFAGTLNVDSVNVNYITAFTKEQLDMSVFWQQKETNEVLRKAKALKLEYRLTLPLEFKKYNTAPCACRDPWEFFYAEMQGTANPCFLAGKHIGNLKNKSTRAAQSFAKIWNGAKYVKLRKGLDKGCKNCINFDKNNVNNVLSHITFRPQTQKKLLKYAKRKLEGQNFRVKKEI
jgi:MoaA/NifB/PqqE/SkfB family radical SAM enzyme